MGSSSEALLRTIIGIYYDVYNGTGRTYPEFIYEQAMADDIRQQGIACRRQSEFRVLYKEQLVGLQRLDLFVPPDVVIEIKVAPKLTNLHQAQAISYLKVADAEAGLLCNLGSPQPEFRRLYRPTREDDNPAGADQSWRDGWSADLLLPELTGAAIGGMYEVHTILGPGLIHRIYANAVYHELQLRGLEAIARREYQVIYRRRLVGEIKFNHIQVGSSLFVFPVAVHDLNSISINNLKAWMKVQQIPLGILANFHPASLKFVVLRVGEQDAPDSPVRPSLTT